MKAKKTTPRVTNSSNRPLWRRGPVVPVLFLAIFALGFFALQPAPKAFGVSPPPDGCYPNFTTAEGCDALGLLTTGAGNTGLGWRSLFLNTTGSFNTGVGGGALALNNGDSNTAVGAAALLLNTTGTENTVLGTDALVFNDTGSQNTALGAFALFSNAGGNFNTATGSHALLSNTEGFNNTAHGYLALYSNTDGNGNTATGLDALFSNTTGNGNTSHGYRALLANTTGSGNTAVGASALLNVTTGTGNIALGVAAGSAITTNNDVICIGAPGPASVSDACFIGHIFGTTSSGGTAVFINSDGRLGTQVSSRRFKEEIKPMERSSEALYALKPVTFRYKKEFDPQGILQFGLVAEDVEAVNPDLVVRDKEGRVNTVHYEVINAMLLNEFLKEHGKVQELEAKVARQQNDSEASEAKQREQIRALTARLDQQAAEIQQVNAKIEVSRPASQLAMRSN